MEHDFPLEISTVNRPATIIEHKFCINNQENLLFRETMCINKENLKRSLWHSTEKNLHFAKNLGGGGRGRTVNRARDSW